MDTSPQLGGEGDAASPKDTRTPARIQQQWALTQGAGGPGAEGEARRGAGAHGESDGPRVGHRSQIWAGVHQPGHVFSSTARVPWSDGPPHRGTSRLAPGDGLRHARQQEEQSAAWCSGGPLPRPRQAALDMTPSWALRLGAEALVGISGRAVCRPGALRGGMSPTAVPGSSRPVGWPARFRASHPLHRTCWPRYCLRWATANCRRPGRRPEVRTPGWRGP